MSNTVYYSPFLGRLVIPYEHIDIDHQPCIFKGVHLLSLVLSLDEAAAYNQYVFPLFCL